MEDMVFVPANFIQYPLPFNLNIVNNSINPDSAFSQDENMRETLNFQFWEGARSGYIFPSGLDADSETFVSVAEPLDDTVIITHLAIYAKEGCEFYIMDYEYHDSEIILDNPNGTIPAGWSIHRRKYRIGIENRLEFQNVRIISVGVVDEDNNNFSYFGKNAQLDMCVTTIGNIKYLDINGNMDTGMIDPFIIDIISAPSGEMGEPKNDVSSQIGGITNLVSSIGNGVAMNLAAGDTITETG